MKLKVLFGHCDRSPPDKNWVSQFLQGFDFYL